MVARATDGGFTKALDSGMTHATNAALFQMDDGFAQMLSSHAPKVPMAEAMKQDIYAPQNTGTMLALATAKDK